MAPKVICSVLVLAVWGCSHGPSPQSPEVERGAPVPGMAPASRDGAPPPTEVDRPSAEHLDEAQALGLALAMLSAGVEQSKLNIGRAKDERVKDFASSVIATHGKAGKELAALGERRSIGPKDSSTATEFRVDATADHQELAKASGHDFDVLYMRSQVRLHERALELLGNAVIPHTADRDLEQSLQSTRERLKAELESARTILDALD